MTNTSSRSIDGLLAAVMLLIATVKDGMGPDSPESDEPTWAAPLRSMAAALSRRDHSRAVRAHEDAHAAVLAARSWEGMLQVGSAALRLGPAGTGADSARGAARRMYLWALVRARGIDSVAGVLRAGEAFAALGDRDMAALGLRVAESLRPDAADPLAFDRLRAQIERLDRGARRDAYGEAPIPDEITSASGAAADDGASSGDPSGEGHSGNGGPIR